MVYQRLQQKQICESECNYERVIYLKQIYNDIIVHLDVVTYQGNLIYGWTYGDATGLLGIITTISISVLWRLSCGFVL